MRRGQQGIGPEGVGCRADGAAEHLMCDQPTKPVRRPGIGCHTEDHRQVIVETYLRDRSHEEVAAELGVPPGTLRSRLFYGLKALRVALDEMGVTP